MKARLLNRFVLIVSLALLSSTLGAAAGGPTSSPPSQEWEGGEGMAAQEQSQDVQLVGQIGGPTYAVAVGSGRSSYIDELAVRHTRFAHHPCAIDSVPYR